MCSHITACLNCTIGYWQVAAVQHSIKAGHRRTTRVIADNLFRCTPWIEHAIGLADHSDSILKLVIETFPRSWQWHAGANSHMFHTT
jgi:hypothetical protein